MATLAVLAIYFVDVYKRQALLTKAKIKNILYFNNMGGELRKGHCGGNYV